MAERERANGGGDRGGSAMTNADFARMFRQEARSSIVADTAGVGNAAAVNAEVNDEYDEQPRGFGFGSARDAFMALGWPSATQNESTESTADISMAAHDGGIGLGVSAATSTSNTATHDSSTGAPVGAGSGMTNADFARMFRQEARNSTVVDTAGVGNAAAVNAEVNDEYDEQPRGFGFGSARDAFMAFGRPPSAQTESTENNMSDRIGTAVAAATATHNTNASSTTTAASASSSSKASTEAPARPDAPPMTRAQLAHYGKWEKHTKGFGMKMLAKMGFTGRLGKDERGVSATIEVVQRPAQMGIGFGNFTEASALSHNRKLQRELRGDTAVADEDAAATVDVNVEDDSLWRKRKTPVGSTTRHHKRAADVQREVERKKLKRSDVVLDMRGPDVRVLATVSDAYAVDLQQQQRLAAATPKLGDELIYNVRMVVNTAQNDIVDVTSKVTQTTARLASLAKETTIITAQVAMESVRLQHVQRMIERMRAVETQADAALQRCDVVDMIALLTDIRAEAPHEFEAYRLHELVPSLCIAPLKALLTSCDLAERASQRCVVQQFQTVQLFLLHVPSADTAGATANAATTTTGAVFHTIHEKINSVGEDLYNYILEETLWPAMSQFIATQWRASAHPHVCIDLVELFAPHLSRAFADALLHQLVLPRLKKEIQRWTLPSLSPSSSSSSSTSIHDWLLPWTSVVGAPALATLFPDVRLALASALNQWHPSDLSVRALLAPWRAHWGEHEYAKFTHRHVVRKLVRCLQREFTVNPAKQSLDALTWVLAWQPHLPERQLVALLEGEFFPSWLDVLRQWVTADALPNLSELATWYSGWKQFFEQPQLAQHPRLVVHFHGALVLLEAACARYTAAIATTRSEDAVAPVAIPVRNRQAPTNYQDALVQARLEDPTAEDGVSSSNDDGRRAAAAGSTASFVNPLQQPPHKASSSHAVGLKDVLENLAIAHNVTFLPKGVHDGQQMYAFGAHHILIDQGVVFAEKTKGVFEPVDIEQLV